jgi:hypothetical protein
MVAVPPDSTRARAHAGQSHWERLRPQSAGRSQANWTRWTATTGGKARGAPRACLIAKAPEPLLAVAFEPLRDHARGHPAPAGHVGQGGPSGPQQDHPRPPCETSGNRRAPLEGCQVAALRRGEEDDQR